jgi:putative copper resistance protein D
MPLTAETLEAAVNACFYVLLALLAGSAALRLAIPALDTGKLSKTSSLALLLPLAAGTVLTTMTIADVELPGVPAMVWPVLHQSQAGWMLLAMFGAVLTLLIAVLPLFSLALKVRQLLATLAFVILCWASAASGHAGEAGLISTAVLTHTGHILAGTTWFGAIAVYLLTARQLMDETLIKLTRHLSEVATFCLLAILLTGLADALRMYQMSSNFWHSDYARLLIFKLAGVICAVGLGGFNRVFTLPRLAQQTQRMRQVFYTVAVVESVILLSVLALAAKLGLTMPDM